MPAYSYKERFVPMVKDGSKPHTIRQRRRHVPKPGDRLYHYYGMRTKFCKKIGDDYCKEVKSIFIDKAGEIYLLNGRLDDSQAQMLQQYPNLVCKVKWMLPGDKVEMFQKLDIIGANNLAWLDGFRPEGSSLENSIGALELMYRWWKQTHSLPFLGDIIYRTDKK